MIRIAKKFARRLRIERAALSPARRPYRYVFHHVPKCAGTTARTAFAFWFVPVPDYHPWWSVEDMSAEYFEWTRRPPDVRRLRAAEMMAGHWCGPGSFLHERHPQVFADARFRAVTILRDPFEARLSYLHYYRRENRPEGRHSQEEWMLMQENPLCALMGIDPENCEAALDRYWFVGISERLPETFAALRKHLGAGPTWVAHRNASERGDERASSALREEFRKRSAGDYRLYAHALRRFEEAEGLGLARVPH